MGRNGEDEQGPRAGRPRRRVFTAEYKRAVLDEYDAAGSGAKGALLRREGLYSSHIVDWRRARERAAAAGLRPRGRRARSAEEVEIERLRRRADRAEAELATTRAALEVVGKARAYAGDAGLSSPLLQSVQ